MFAVVLVVLTDGALAEWTFSDVFGYFFPALTHDEIQQKGFNFLNGRAPSLDE